MNQENIKACTFCGCTCENACPGGCYWVADDLCSQCAQEVTVFSVVLSNNTDNERHVESIENGDIQTAVLDELSIKMLQLSFEEAFQLKTRVKKLTNEPVEIVYVQSFLGLDEV